MSTLPKFRELGRISALDACTNKVDRNDRALIKFNSAAFENHTSAWVCRQLSNAYLNSSNANVIQSGRNFIVARRAALIASPSLSARRALTDRPIRLWIASYHQQIMVPRHQTIVLVGTNFLRMGRSSKGIGTKATTHQKGVAIGKVVPRGHRESLCREPSRKQSRTHAMGQFVE